MPKAYIISHLIFTMLFAYANIAYIFKYVWFIVYAEGRRFYVLHRKKTIRKSVNT